MMKNPFLPALLMVVLAAYCSLHGLSSAAVISIDFGSEWIKVALVKPGIPMEIVLNKESKRKTAAVVSLRNGDRLFGDPALNTAVKYPKNAYRYLQLLVGQKFESPMVHKYKQWFPFYDLKKDEDRGTVLFQHDQDTVYSVEELVGMIFNNSRHIAEAYAGVPIRDVVITIPPFFSQAQRRSVIHIASMVGLNVLQLMSDNAAAALNYGLFRQASFNTTPHYIMFYDMGSSSTTATIIEYRKVQVKEGTLANVHPQLSVKGTGYDLLLGGLEMDIRLQQHLAKLFQDQKKTKGSVYDSPRAMAKLLKEAKRLKQVLSANSDHFAQIEGLLEDVDFRAKVTRDEFESLCSDMLERVGDPVEQALDAADMTMLEIDSVILVGGGTRVPKIQELLLKAVNKPELGKSLNTDEAIALGAVYQGAGHTKLFRVKKFIVKEESIFPIQVAFSRVVHSEEEIEEDVVRTVKRTLFQRSNTYPAKKVLTFNRHTSDFSFQVFYGDIEFLSAEEKSYLGRLNLTEVYLAGVSEALSEHPQGEAKGIKAHFNMDESGILNITRVESVFEYPEDVEEQSTLSKIGSSISSFFGMGGTDSAADEEPSNEGEEVPADGNETETATTMERDSESRTPESETENESVDAQVDSTSDSIQEEEEEEPVLDEPEQEIDVPEEEEEPSVVDEPEGEEQSVDEPEEVGSEGEGEEQSVDEPEEVGSEGEGEEQSVDEPEEVGSEEEGEEPPTNQPTESSSDEEQGDTTGPGPDTTADNTTADSATASNASNATTTAKKPKGSVVRVNLTTEVTVLDLSCLAPEKTTLSIEKLEHLHQIDEDKVANEKAKNSLESHIFETKDAMFSEEVMGVSTAEQRGVIATALTEAADWLEEDGYIADTKVYKTKLKELKRISRSVFKRVAEAASRPKLLSSFASSLNMSQDFLSRMKNLSSEVQIFTEVEISTLETLTEEAEQWMTEKLAEQKVTPPHEDPPLMSHEIEDQIKKLDREIMYLLKKLRSHQPPAPKLKTNSTTDKTNNTTKSKPGDTSDIPTEDTQTTPTEEPQTTPIGDEPILTEQPVTEEVVPEPLEVEGLNPEESSLPQQQPGEGEEPHQEL